MFHVKSGANEQSTNLADVTAPSLSSQSRSGLGLAAAALTGVAAFLAPSANAEIVTLQNRMQPGFSPQAPGFSTLYENQGVFAGFGITSTTAAVPPRYFVFEQTFTPEMAGQTATISLATTININGQRTVSASDITSATGRFANTLWGLRLNVYSQATFNPNDVDQGIVTSFDFQNTSTPVVQIGRIGPSGLSPAVMLLSYQFVVPQGVSDAVFALSGAPSNLPSIPVFGNYSVSYGLCSAFPGWPINAQGVDRSLTQLPGDDLTQQFDPDRRAAFSLDVNVVPSPGAAAVLGLAAIGIATRRRRE